MEDRWNTIGLQFLCFSVLIFGFEIQGSRSINNEGLVLLIFRERITSDPNGAFGSWISNHSDPCFWFGVGCVDGKVQVLDLNGLSLEGRLVSELGKLINLRSLILKKNQFSGNIPKEIGELTNLELLDLRDNNFSGKVPAEIGNLFFLKGLLLCGNKFEGSIPPEISKLNLLSELQADLALACTVAGTYRKLGYVKPHQDGIQHITYAHEALKFGRESAMRQSSMRPLTGTGSLQIPSKREFKTSCCVFLLHSFKHHKDSIYDSGDGVSDRQAGVPKPPMIQNVEILVSSARRKLLDQSSNLQAASVSGSLPSQIIAIPITRSSGTFPALVNPKKNVSPPPESPVSPPPKDTEEPNNLDGKAPNHVDGNADKHTDRNTNKLSGNKWLYVLIIPIIVVLLVIIFGLLFICRKEGVKTIGPWTTGLSGQLQKAFVTGVPKLNRAELEVACEDFSNIVTDYGGFTVYKGTLSTGVEIAVATASAITKKDWSRAAEKTYRKKIDTLSRVNHKNFVNLLGFCEEDEPFARMMVFEYAPNGSLFEHLHVKEMEHLDWSARMRIIMGIAYCLQYMHNDLNPPVFSSNLDSTNVVMTDDYAAKLAEMCFAHQSNSRSKISGDDESEHSALPPQADPESNVYGFGILLLEIISGKLPFSEEHGLIDKWAAQYLNDKQSISSMIDPTLESFKDNELEIICEVVRECIRSDPKQRPTMKEMTAKLSEVIGISPEQATPRLSPLWWAELEILSVEAT